ncbi:MAG: rod shape-determining protein RodA [Treponema sp.]|nr:rod shape-determining protein RodA [Treponema sp.]
MKSKFLNRFDFIILLCVIFLSTFGILFVYSARFTSKGLINSTQYIKQIIWAGVGLVFIFFICLGDYKRIRRYSHYLFIFLLGILVFTRLFGRKVNGARSWLGIGGFGIQPSEFGKILFIFYMARFLEESKNMDGFLRFVFGNLIMFLPMGLILTQPDLGTASVYFPIFLFMGFMAGIPVRYLLFELGFLLLTIVLSVLPVYNQFIPETPHPFLLVLSNFRLRLVLIFVTGMIAAMSAWVRRFLHGKKYFYWITYIFLCITGSLILSMFMQKFLTGITNTYPDGTSKAQAISDLLKHPSKWLEFPTRWRDLSYQMKRLIIFMKPEIDIQGAGWNIYQSKIAIGSGGFWGRGFLQGTQSHNGWLPEQSTDFIFGILSEETGFIGGFAILSIYMILFLRIIQIIKNNQSVYGTYIATGILAMYAFHFFINIGMLMGIMPITGIPLLFLSYGGSSLLTAMICAGILMNINYHKMELH